MGTEAKPARFDCTRSTYLVCTLVVTLSVLVYTTRTHDTHLVCPSTNLPPHIDVVVNLNKTNTSAPTREVSGMDWDYNWDRKAWANPEDARGVGVRCLILIRHGQYNLTTGELNQNGHRQANYTAQRLWDFNVKFERIVHSDMARARTTAGLIHNYLPNVPLHEDPMIQEGGPIPPLPTINYWSLPEKEYFQNGPRLEAAFRKYFYRADKSQTQMTREILVGHGNIFRFFLLRALQLPKTAWMRVFIPHASISRVYINPDGTVTADMFGDAGHIPYHYITS